MRLTHFSAIRRRHFLPLQGQEDVCQESTESVIDKNLAKCLLADTEVDVNEREGESDVRDAHLLCSGTVSLPHRSTLTIFTNLGTTFAVLGWFGKAITYDCEAGARIDCSLLYA